MEEKQQAKNQQFKFDVFISYRHAELDSAVAGYLQKSLEHYRIPREIQRKCGKPNIHRVFRDEEELGVASDLFGEIEENLKQSEFLLVICSPRIVQSKWCLKEIETFIQYHGRDNVLAVLIEGEPETAFPPILLEKGEPLAADLRGKNKRQVLKYARERMPRLVAPLVYCSYDELYQRHRVYRMRRAFTLASLVAVLALGFGAVTVKQNMEITENYLAKLENQSRHLAQKSAELLSQGNREAALLVALEALPESSVDTSRPYVAEARIALENALCTYSMNTQLRPLKMLEHKSTPVSSCSDYNMEEKALLTLDSDGRIYVWDCEADENICCWEEEGRACSDARLAGEHRVVAAGSQGLFCFDYLTKEILWEWNFPECQGSACSFHSLPTANTTRAYVWDYHAATGTIVCVTKRIGYEYTADYSAGSRLFDTHLIYVLDVDTGESHAWKPQALYGRLDEDDSLSLNIEGVSLSPDGRSLLVAESEIVNTSEGNKRNYRMYVLPVLGDQAVFYQEYAESWGLPAYVWLDVDTLGIVETFGRAVAMNTMGYRDEWEFTCWEVSSGRPRFTHRDSAVTLYGEAEVAANYPVSEEGNVTAVITIAYDNVMVCLDWYTGEQYSRIEDRSTIRPVMNCSDASDVLLLSTADGYVFFTNTKRDYIFNPLYSAEHYYLNLGIIRKAEWHNRRAYFYTDTAVYCYSTTIAALADTSYTLLEMTPGASWFARDSKSLFMLGHQSGAYDEGVVCLYDTDSFKLRWQDDCAYSRNGMTAAYLDGGYAVYLEKGRENLKIHSVQEETDVLVKLESDREDDVYTDDFFLCPAGEDVLVWREGIVRADARAQRKEQLQAAAVWMADAGQGTMKRKWSYQEILDQIYEALPEAMKDGIGTEDETEEEALVFNFEEAVWLTVTAAAVTADGRYAVICCMINSAQDSSYRTFLSVWDLESGQPAALPKEIQEGLFTDVSGAYYKQDGWLSPEGSSAVLYDAQNGLLKVVELAGGEVLCELPVDGVGSREVAFTPDGEYLVFQDSSRRLCVYQWKEEKYTMRNTTPEIGAMSFAFYENGSTLCAVLTVNIAASKTVNLYQNMGNGAYKLETSIGSCIDCDGKTVVIRQEDQSRLYPFHTLDDLITQARQILNGRELTELERESYLID